MTDLSEADAQKLRDKLAAHEAKQAKAAVEAENKRRTEARAAVQPVADALLTPEVEVLLETVEGFATSLPQSERDLANLSNNARIVLGSLIERIKQRIADTETTPVTETP